MKKSFFVLFLLVYELSSMAQFAPPAGQAGTSAIYKDSSVFVAWASGCTVVQGYQDISNPPGGYANAGDNTMGTGMVGSNGTVSLGDGGIAILTFDAPIADGVGPDFAVFENSFSDDFLELAFVEVSSDGINYFRFPSTSNTQDTVQTGSFDPTDATKINNLAGKYRFGYGTPFDLQELAGIPGLDIYAVTHVKIMDVVGSIDPLYATYDAVGNKVNDPWPTPFGSSGFDLDAVGVINVASVGIKEGATVEGFTVFPNPSNAFITIELSAWIGNTYSIELKNTLGQTVYLINGLSSTHTIDVRNLPNDLYVVEVILGNKKSVKKVLIQ